MTHEPLVSLVAQSNGVLMTLSWPFIMYEALGKAASTLDLKAKLDLCRGQILSSIVFEIEETLQPYWPRVASRIILEPEYHEETSTALSDGAKDAIRACLVENEHLSVRAARIRGLAAKVLSWDRVCYWFTVCTAMLALCGLVLWFFYTGMSDSTAKFAIGIPLSPAVLALLAAATRQIYVHRANDAIIKEEE